MKRRQAWLLWLVAAAAPLAAAQTEGATDPAAELPGEGFWPTPRMIELIIDRITEDGVGLYNFDEIQLAETRKLLKERIPAWMSEHRGEIMTLTNQFLEAQLGDEPPSAEDVAKWAKRVTPLVQSFEGEVVKVTDSMREFLDETQIVVLEGEVAAFRTGVQFATNKMRVWEEGGYDPDIDWHRSPESRRYRHEEEDIAEEAMKRERANAIARAEGKPEPFPEGYVEASPEAAAPIETGAPPAVAQPVAAPSKPKAEAKDEFAIYVEQFIKKYDLNADQQSKARSLLKRAQTQRDEHLRRNTPKMRELEAQFKELKSAKSEDAAKRLADAEARYRKLYEPIDNAFTRMKDKLEDLPTREQRRKVKEQSGGDVATEPAKAETDVVQDGARTP